MPCGSTSKSLKPLDLKPIRHDVLRPFFHPPRPPVGGGDTGWMPEPEQRGEVEMTLWILRNLSNRSVFQALRAHSWTTSPTGHDDQWINFMKFQSPPKVHVRWYHEGSVRRRQ